jgi:hypothetical protein
MVRLSSPILFAVVSLPLAVLVGCSVESPSSCMTASTDTCSLDTICVSNSCTAAFPHAYAITQLSATAPNLKPDGTQWNADRDGTPDLFVEIYVNGTVVKTTDVNPMSFNATFTGPYAVMLDANAALDLKASNKTTSGTSELVFDCPIPMVTAQLLRTRYVLCSGTGVTINYTIDPS